MEHSISHDLPLPEAKRVARHAVDAYASRFEKYGPEVTWTGDDQASIAFKAKGVRLKGGFRVEPDRIRMQLEVPLLLRPFTSRALRAIDTEAQQWIAKAKAGEL
jgi:hypothetical protein